MAWGAKTKGSNLKWREPLLREAIFIEVENVSLKVNIKDLNCYRILKFFSLI